MDDDLSRLWRDAQQWRDEMRPLNHHASPLGEVRVESFRVVIFHESWCVEEMGACTCPRLNASHISDLGAAAVSLRRAI